MQQVGDRGAKGRSDIINRPTKGLEARFKQFINTARSAPALRPNVRSRAGAHRTLGGAT